MRSNEGQDSDREYRRRNSAWCDLSGFCRTNLRIWWDFYGLDFWRMWLWLNLAIIISRYWKYMLNKGLLKSYLFYYC